MRTTRLLVSVLILALAITGVAVPATTFAQSAGDEQYVDPFQDEGGGNSNSNGNGNNNNSQGGGGDDGSAPAEEQVAQAPADTGATAGTTSAETGDQGALPTTGLAVGGVALAGAVLLGGGMMLRRIWARPR
jgi:hypothetical protein